jgi:hypothetical protein
MLTHCSRQGGEPNARAARVLETDPPGPLRADSRPLGKWSERHQADRQGHANHEAHRSNQRHRHRG